MVERITLYRAPTTSAATDDIAEWLRERVDADVEIRERFLDRYGDDDLAAAFARARVLDPYERETAHRQPGVVEAQLHDPNSANTIPHGTRDNTV